MYKEINKNTIET